MNRLLKSEMVKLAKSRLLRLGGSANAAASYTPAALGRALGISAAWIADFALPACCLFQRAELK